MLRSDSGGLAYIRTSAKDCKYLNKKPDPQSLPELLPEADESHDVPGAFWKVVIAKPKGEPWKVAAFIMNQTATTADDFEDTQTTIRVIPDRCGFVLFPELDAALTDSRDEEWVATWADLQ